MTDADFLQRIDAHMERGNELMGQIQQEIALNRREAALTREEIVRNRGEIVRNRSAYADFKTVVADCKLEFAKNRAQHERAMQTYQRLERFTDEVSRRNERAMGELVEEIRDLRAGSQDMRDESIAQREALLKLIDEMRSGRQGPPPQE